jgi:beta-lactamase regulating signal transducer with metallopeptidase domain
MLTYLIQMIACSGVLYAYYHFFLRNEKFHQYNRFYLLFAMALSLILPLFKIPVIVEDAATNPIYAFVSTEKTVLVTATAKPFDYVQLLYVTYGCIVLGLIARLMKAIRQIIRIKREANIEAIEGIRFIKTLHPDAPFSFFKWMFWNKNTELESAEGRHIFNHEMYHIDNKHSWDLLFSEILLCLYWFNPFFYLYRKEIATIQEFLADKHATKEQDRYDYAELLIRKAISQQQQKLINPFFHNQLKRRITMLTTSEKTAWQWSRKLFTIPLFLLIASVTIIRCKAEDKKEEAGITSTNVTSAATPPPADSVAPPTNIEAVVQPSENKNAITNSKEPVLKNEKGEVIPGPDVFSKVEVDAKYPGNWRSFLEKHLDGQVAVDNGAGSGTYTTIIQFIVDTKGNVSDVKALTNIGYGLEEESIRVIKQSGKWMPAIMNGRPVKAYRKQPITFQVTEA